jgi:hypothetical protein
MRNNEERFGTPPQLHDTTPPQVLQQQTQGLSLDFIVPTEIVALPSRGKFYPVGHPLKDKDSIEIKQMTAKEEDILTSKSLLKKGIALDKLIQSLIVDKSIIADTITIDDRNAIIIAARIAAYGAEYATNVSCPSCNQKTKFTFNLLEKLPKEDEEDSKQVDVDENGFFTITLPATKWSVVCRTLNGIDEKNLLKISEAKKKLANDSIFLEQLKCMIVSIENVTDRQMIEKALSVVPAGDTRFLRKEYQKNIESVDMRQNFICSNCDFETEMEVPLSADFFWFK